MSDKKSAFVLDRERRRIASIFRLGGLVSSLSGARSNTTTIHDSALAPARNAPLLEVGQAIGGLDEALFERASAAARIGIWECRLPGEELRWSRGTYDLFEMPYGAPLDRAQTIKCYTPASLKALTALRDTAIKEQTGFTLDAEIITPGGRHRWLRLTASVETANGEAVRIFGFKQDITEEKLLWERTRYLAEFDPMTGLANRSRFQAELARLCEAYRFGKPAGGLMLIDLDGFKAVNDTIGHVGGDLCLKKVAGRLAGIYLEAELVARVGGDEFAILTPSGAAPETVSGVARAIVAAMHEPIMCEGHKFDLGASVGIAFVSDYPGQTLYKQADQALYAAKAAGGGTFRLFGVPDRDALSA